jgi:hypothetical protein
MSDNKLGKFSESSPNSSAKDPIMGTNPPTEGGFMSSAMNFFNKNKTIIIGVIVLIVVGFIVYKYFYKKEKFQNIGGGKAKHGATRNLANIRRRQLQNEVDQNVEDFDENYEGEDNVEDFDGAEDYDEANADDIDGAEGFDGVDGADGTDAVEDFEAENYDEDDQNVEEFEETGNEYAEDEDE